MSEAQDGQGKFGFLDSIAGLLRRKKAPATAAAPAEAANRVEAAFEAAIRELNKKVEEHGRAAGPTASGSGAKRTQADRAAEREKRLVSAHRAMLEDIQKSHARLGTALAGQDLDALAGELSELEAIAVAGRDSHVFMPRARFAIANRVLHEAGELAITRLVALLGRADMGWPEPDAPHSTPERAEQLLRQKRAQLRETFLAQGFGRTAERMIGIVQGWGSDYPDPGTWLWQETVLEGVAAGIRARLVEDFVEVLRSDRDLIMSRVEASIGEQIAALQDVVANGVHSMEQANQAVSTALRAFDQVVPEIAWEHVRSKLPEARGEFPA